MINTSQTKVTILDNIYATYEVIVHQVVHYVIVQSGSILTHTEK